MSDKMNDGSIVVEHFHNIQGVIEGEISPSMYEHIKKTKELLSSTIPELEQFDAQSKRLVGYFEGISKTLSEMKHTSSNLFRAHLKFNKGNQHGDTYYNQQIYLELANILSTWSVFYRNQSKKVDETFSNYFSYSSKENEALLELLKVRNSVTTVFHQSYRSLSSKKQKLYEEGYSEKWGFTLSQYKIDEFDLCSFPVLAKNLMLPKV